VETHCGRPGTGAAGGRETPSCLQKESTEIEPKEREREHFLWRGDRRDREDRPGRLPREQRERERKTWSQGISSLIFIISINAAHQADCIMD